MNIADHAIGQPRVAGPDRRGRRRRSRTASCTRGANASRPLLHEAGLRRGDGVALVLPNRPEFFEITWGCQLSGLYYSAVNTHFTPDEVAYVIDDSDAKAVFVDASMAELGERILRGQRRRRRPHQRRRRAARLAVVRRRLGRQRATRRRSRTGRRCSTRRAPPGGPRPFAGRCRTDGNGSWAQKVLEYCAGAALRHDRRRACTCRRRRCTTRRESTTRWRSIGWAPPRS